MDKARYIAYLRHYLLGVVTVVTGMLILTQYCYCIMEEVRFTVTSVTTPLWLYRLKLDSFYHTDAFGASGTFAPQAD